MDFCRDAQSRYALCCTVQYGCVRLFVQAGHVSRSNWVTTTGPAADPRGGRGGAHSGVRGAVRGLGWAVKESMYCRWVQYNKVAALGEVAGGSRRGAGTRSP